MLPTWIFSLAIYYFASSTYSLLQRKYSQSSAIPLKLIPAIVFGLVVYPVAVIVALLWGNIWIDWQWQTITLLIVASIFIGAFNVAPFRINKHIDTTQYLIISNIYTPITVLIGVFVLHEAFTGTQFIGMLLLIVGAILVAAKGFKRNTFKFDKHSVELAALAILLGIGLATEKAALSFMSPSAYMIIGYGLQAIATFYFAREDLPAVRNINKQGVIELLQLGSARSGHVIGYFLSVAISRNVALIASLTSFRIPIVFVASIFVLKEREQLTRKFIGVIIATIGLILL